MSNAKGYNIGHLNIQGLCGDKLSKFSEISFMLTSKENEKLHIFGMSETKLKIISQQELLKLMVFKDLSERTMIQMAVGV